MKIAIIGATGEGLTVAAYLQKTYTNVTIFDVQIQPLEQIQLRGVTIHTNQTLHIQIPVKTIEQFNAQYDFVFLFTHPKYNNFIFPLLKKQLCKNCFIISFQENLSDWDLVQYFSEHPVLSAVCHFKTYVKNHHQVVLTTSDHLLAYDAFAIYDYKPQQLYYAEEVKNVLDAVGYTQIVRAAGDIKWTQAVFSGAIDRLASALNCLYGDILYHPIALKTVVHLADEIVRIAKKYNIRLAKIHAFDYTIFMIDSDTKVTELIPIVKQLLEPHKKMFSDQNQDLIDELLEIAHLVDQPTPYLKTLARCLQRRTDFHLNISSFQRLVMNDL